MDPITASLEGVGDPSEAIYARLFERFPETKERFDRDVSGSIRAEMLTMVFDCLMNPAGPYQAALVRTERVNHDGFGTPGEVFDSLFWIVRDVCRERLGAGWTAETDAAWTAQIQRLLAVSR